jgi:signal transduction histidine kinase
VRRDDSWPVAFVLFAAVGGYLVAAAGANPLYLLVFPLVHAFVLYSSRRAGHIVEVDESEKVRARLTEVVGLLGHANERAALASEGLMRAAELALRTEEDVRARIVSDLHDSPAQSLVAVNYLRADPNVTIDEIVEVAQTAEAELRDVMREQRPLPPGKTLAELVANHLAEVETRWNLRVNVEWEDGGTSTPYPVAVVIFRFVAEALMNVVKHADTNTAWLRVKASVEELRVVVSDDGTGFDTSILESTDRLGLSLINHRAGMVGGSVQVRSSERGTSATLVVPILA